jgi:hypothetical protein
LAAGLDPSRLSVSVTWTNGDNWPLYVNPNTGQVLGNIVIVRLSYNWIPEAFFGGVTLTSTSVMPVSY